MKITVEERDKSTDSKRYMARLVEGDEEVVFETNYLTSMEDLLTAWAREHLLEGKKAEIEGHSRLELVYNSCFGLE